MVAEISMRFLAGAIVILALYGIFQAFQPGHAAAKKFNMILGSVILVAGTYMIGKLIVLGLRAKGWL